MTLRTDQVRSIANWAGFALVTLACTTLPDRAQADVGTAASVTVEHRFYDTFDNRAVNHQELALSDSQASLLHKGDVFGSAPSTGSGSSTASLISGKLGVNGVTECVLLAGDDCVADSQVGSDALIADVITLRNSAENPAISGINFLLDGGLSGAASVSLTYRFVQLPDQDFTSDLTSFEASVSRGPFGAGANFFLNGELTDGYFEGSFLDIITAGSTMLIPAGTSHWQFSMELAGSSFGEGSFSYSHTATARLALPASVSASALSGVQGGLLENLASATPEPGTWAMMLLGFSVTGTSLRRKSRRMGAATC